MCCARWRSLRRCLSWHTLGRRRDPARRPARRLLCRASTSSACSLAAERGLQPGTRALCRRCEASRSGAPAAPALRLLMRLRQPQAGGAAAQAAGGTAAAAVRPPAAGSRALRRQLARALRVGLFPLLAAPPGTPSLGSNSLRPAYTQARGACVSARRLTTSNMPWLSARRTWPGVRAAFPEVQVLCTTAGATVGRDAAASTRESQGRARWTHGDCARSARYPPAHFTDTGTAASPTQHGRPQGAAKLPVCSKSKAASQLLNLRCEGCMVLPNPVLVMTHSQAHLTHVSDQCPRLHVHRDRDARAIALQLMSHIAPW